MKMLRNKPILNRKRFVIILSILILVIQHPFSILIPAGGRDPSWFLGLKWAALKGLVFGQDIAFTYGPLYFLVSAPLNIGHHTSLLLEESIFFILRFSVILLVVSQFAGLIYKKPWRDYSAIDGALIVLGLSLFAFLPLVLVETILVLSCILFIRLIFEIEYSKANRKKHLLNILLNTALLGIVCLTKFTYTIVALVLILIALIGLVYKKKAILILHILLSFVVFYLTFWVLCGQSFSALLDYFYYGIEISSGYTEAMMRRNVYNEINYGLFAFFVLLFIGTSSLFFFVKKDFYHALILFFTLPLLFMAFKEAFVRADEEHIILYFYQLFSVIIFFIIFIVDKSFFRYKTIGQLFIICILSVAAVVIIRHYKESDSEKYPFMKLLFPDGKSVFENKELIRKSYPALSPEFLQQTKNKTFDVFPCDISLLYAYDLNWTPRPVFQSYLIHTPVLDQMNASHFEKNTAPDNIIYSYYSLENRYPLFDEPIVFRTLLKNYKVHSLNDYLILQRRSEKINCDSIPVVNGVCPLGTLIDVPQCPGQHVFCNMDISIHLGGKLISLLYKPTFMYIYFYIKGQAEPIEYVFNRRIGGDGLFISKYVADLSDISSIFEGEYLQDIEKIKIEVNYNFSYSPDMKYEFYAVPIKKK